MIRKTFILYLLALVALGACSAKDSVTAVIRVTYGDPPQASVDKYFSTTQREVLTSQKFLRHIGQTLELPKLWKVSEEEVAARLAKIITVESGSEPGMIIIEAKGLDHQLAVKVLNELCSFYADEKQGFAESQNGGPLEKVHVEIVQRAE